MTRQEVLRRSTELLARFAYEVKVSNAMGLFDINTIAEDFLVPIFATIFGCPDLRNQNRIKMNFPAVDLGSEISRISIQVTSDPSSSKVSDTLEKFKSNELDEKFDRLLVYIITDKQKSYNSKKLLETTNGLSIDFKPSKDILDYKDLSKMIKELENAHIGRINKHLEGEFSKRDSHLQFRSNLDAFLRVSKGKIEDEKRTKKYISSVFVETSDTKEIMRYFANPMFFYRKIDDDLRRFNLIRFNELLSISKIEPLAHNFTKLASLEAPTSLSELHLRLEQQSLALNTIGAHIAPFSWYREDVERFEPDENAAAYWNVFRYSIESHGDKVFRAIKKISKKIQSAQAKIFLVTGMAGQGKTNFVCDLVENQFRVFEIPTIFIPARSLNDYPSPNRILSYIKNNRFAPNISDSHELFTLLNNVAEECQKPFVIAIDGINEVGDLDGFVSELRIFLEALCQYDFIKIVITCRSEFFDHKFATVFEPQFCDYLFRVEDLRSEMSDANKSRLLKAYQQHFEIEMSLSESATEFLENDLILLRIFAEIHEGTNIGFISDLYKGDIFEKYLKKKIGEFPTRTEQREALQSLYKVCSRMLDKENFTQLSVEGFDDSEQRIIERLIGEDIILRREVPSQELSNIGIENISFTYDELRDFLLAHYTVHRLVGLNPSQVEEIFKKISEWPIYEGFFRYAYILARKKSCTKVLALCENFDNFFEHYLNNLSFLSSDIQTPEDVERIKSVLENSDVSGALREVAWFLWERGERAEYLNIRILLDHVSSLDDEESKRFIHTMFSKRNDYEERWQKRVSRLLSQLENFSEEKLRDICIPKLVLLLHFVPHAHWNVREKTLNTFAKYLSMKNIHDAVNIAKNTASAEVQRVVNEIIYDGARL